MSALKVAENSTAVIYVPRGMGLVVNGGTASGATGAGAGIEVPSSSTLVITGGGTIIATGGNAADGGNGENGINASLDYYNTSSQRARAIRAATDETTQRRPAYLR